MKLAWLTIFLIFCFLTSFSQANQAPLASGEQLRRKTERNTRENIAKNYVGARRSAEAPYLSSLANIAKWLVTLDAKTDARKIFNEIATINNQYTDLKTLEKLLGDITAPKDLNETQRKELETRLKLARKQRSESLQALASVCYRAGLLGYAYDLALECLMADPDNAIVRAAMLHVKVGNDWMPRYDALQMQQSNVYVSEAGWTPKTAVERVKAGEWLENNRFMPMAEADKLHANINAPWIIETENFLLKSTATRKQAIIMAERLEAIRALCFRQYLDFFLRGSKQKGAKLLFSAPFEKKLTVNYYGRKDDFVTTVRELKTASSKEILLRSAGFFSIAHHASFFYYDPDFGSSQQMMIMQHEITHQILGEYSRGGGGALWLIEGAAEGLEAAQFDVNGRLRLLVGYEHPDTRKAAKFRPPDLALEKWGNEEIK